MRYVDPDGQIIINSSSDMMNDSSEKLGNGPETINKQGCTLTSYVRMANALGANVSLETANKIANENNFFDDKNRLTVTSGASLVNALLQDAGIKDVSISYESSASEDKSGNNNQYRAYQEHESSDSEYFCNARIYTSNADQTDFYEHTVSVDSNALISDRCDGAPTNMKIRDTSRVGRSQIHGDTCFNNLERLDFFKINRTSESN